MKLYLDSYEFRASVKMKRASARSRHLYCRLCQRTASGSSA